ncbi:hypothetical protein SERLA73DRAFT_17455, partial [Serpula lacrymans var. lacrymans S7.3]
YHNSILTGYGWVRELVDGHPGHIMTELGVQQEVFSKLLDLLQANGYLGSSTATVLREE